jgi:hypothetical protein
MGTAWTRQGHCMLCVNRPLTVQIAAFFQYCLIASRAQDLLRNPSMMSRNGSWKHKPSARVKNWNEVVTRIYNREQQEDGSTYIMRHVLGLNTVVFWLTCDLVGGAVGSGTALQSRRLWIRFPMGSLYSFIHLILPDALRPCGRLSL